MFEHRESDPRRLVLSFCVLFPSEHCTYLHIPQTLSVLLEFLRASRGTRSPWQGFFLQPQGEQRACQCAFSGDETTAFLLMSIVMGVHCLRDLYPPLSAFRSSPDCSSAPTWSIMNTLHSIVRTSFKPQICLDGLGCCSKTGLCHACIKKTRGGTSPIVQW